METDPFNISPRKRGAVSFKEQKSQNIEVDEINSDISEQMVEKASIKTIKTISSIK